MIPSTLAIELFGAFIVLEYVKDWTLIIAACLGSFIGTAYPVWRAAKSKTQE